MSDGRKYYCFCESNCRFETMTKEQILAAIAQAAENGLVFDTDAAFISKVKESNAGQLVTFWRGTQAQYNAIAEKDPNCFYIITDSEESRLLENHIGSEDNPHNVTIEQIGAAPDGYGLGTAAITVDSWDNAIANGFYQSNKGAPTSTWYYGFVHSYDKTGNWLIQKVWSNAAGGGAFCSAERRRAGGTWGEWEWVNPPMNWREEYRTTERHNGKPVYVVWLNIELQNNYTTIVELPSVPSKIIEMHGTAKSDAYTEAVNFPIITFAGAIGARLYKTGTKDIAVKTFADYSGYDATVTVKYTKD